jgi:ubiquinone biosynthesis protein
VDLLQPYYVKAMKRRFSPEKLLHKLQRSYRDWERLIDVLPRELADVLHYLRNGNLDIHLEHRRLDAVVNRLVYGILSAALFLGSCQLWSQEIPPMIGEISIIGASGCIAALFLAFRLLRAIKRSGGLGRE